MESVRSRIAEVLKIEAPELGTTFDAIQSPVHRFLDYEKYDDDIVIGERCHLFDDWADDDKLLVETFFGPPRGEDAFCIPAVELRRVVENYFELYGQMFFSGGDIFVVSMTTDSIWAFHHEGAWVRHPT